jgi:hypothetical protein
MNISAVIEVGESEFLRGHEFTHSVLVSRLVKEAASTWRWSLNRKPIDAEDEPARYEALLDRVKVLLAAEKIDLEMADAIVGRRDIGVKDLELLIQLFAAVDKTEYLAGSLVGGLVGGDYYLWCAEEIVEAFETALATGVWQ